MEQKWPQQIWLVRHGRSAGHVARDVADAAKGHLIDIAERGVDVPLAELGVRQSQAPAGWFPSLPEVARPNVVLHSPYLRAAETARILRHTVPGGSLLATQVDERLREKEFGILDRLTTHGISHRYPELYQQRQHVGKFYRFILANKVMLARSMASVPNAWAAPGPSSTEPASRMRCKAR